MERLHGSSKEAEESRTSIVSQSSTPAISNESSNERLMHARDQNDNNRYHLNTAFNVYKQLYGEDAANEAFMEIASKISAEEDESVSHSLTSSHRPSIDESVSSSQAAADGQTTTPRYLSYRQSLSSLKDRLSNDRRQNLNNSMQPHAEVKNVSPSSITSYHGSDVIREYEEQVNNTPGTFMMTIPAPAAPVVVPVLVPPNKIQPDIESTDESDILRGVTSATSDITENTPSHGTLEPPRYIKYRATLRDKSVTSSIKSENSKMIRVGTVEVPDEDHKSDLPPASNLSSTATAGYATPVQLAPATESDSLASAASTSAVKGGEYVSSLPRYVKYRDTLAKRSRGEMTSISENQVLSGATSPTSSPEIRHPLHGGDVIREYEEQVNKPPSTFTLATPAPSEQVIVPSFVPSNKIQPDIESTVESDISRAVTSSDSDITENTPSQGTSEPPRYIKYRASLGDKSVASSIKSENSKMIRIGTVEVSGEDNKSGSPSASNLSTTATAGYATPVQLESTTDSDSLASEASTSAVTGGEYVSSLPRYVKYRDTLAKRSRGEMTSISENQVLPASTSPIYVSDVRQSTRKETDVNDVHSRSQNEQGADSNSDADAEPAVALDTVVGMAVDNSQGDISSVASTAASVSSSQRYMAYRSTLKDKPWTPSTKDTSFFRSTQTGISSVETGAAESILNSTEVNNEDINNTDLQIKSEIVPSTNAYDDNLSASFQNLSTGARRDDISGETSGVNSSAAASTENILKDLYSAEQSAGIVCDNRTMVSELTEVSSKASTSIAEQILISTSLSVSDDEGMASSIADHSAVTPIISNSAHNKSKNLEEKPVKPYLYNSDSSFDTDTDTDAHLMYMANVPSSPIRDTNNNDDNRTASAIVSEPSSNKSADVFHDREMPKTPNSGSENLNLKSIPKVISKHDKSTFASAESGNELIAAEALSSPHSKSQLGKDDSSVVDSSDDSSASSSSSSASSSSAESAPPLRASANIGTSYDSEVATNAHPFGSQGGLQETSYSDLYQRDSNKVPTTLTKDDQNINNLGVGYTSSDDDEIARNAEFRCNDDPETGDVSGLGLKPNRNALWEEAKQREKALERRKCIYRTLLFLILTLLSAAVTAAILYWTGGKEPKVAPPLEPSPSPTVKPSTPSTPVAVPTPSTLQPTVSDTELFSLLAGASSDNGTAMSTPGTPQSDALLWLADDPNLSQYNDTRKIQRYALTTFYYSSFGKNWTNSTGWGTYTDECLWFSRSTRIKNCDSEGNYQNLDLAFNEVSGRIPPEIGMLTRLSRFIMSGGVRRRLIGSLPTELGLLTRMETFMIQGNSIRGVLPEELGNWKDVVTLDLSLNSLFGTIPSSVGRWQSLRFLDFSANRFVGQIPSSIEQLTSLERLSLGSNVLTGTIPTTIEKMTSLKVINLEKNKIKEMPNQIANMERLETVIMSENELEGTLMTEIGNLLSLRELKLNNNSFSGPIPAEIGDIGSLRYLDLSFNNFTSSIPPRIGNLVGILTLQLEHNQLDGVVPAELSNLASASIIRVDHNNLSGSIPSEVCNAFRIEYPAFSVDCGGEQPEVYCPEFCCTSCCTDESGCKCSFTGTTFDFLCRR